MDLVIFQTRELPPTHCALSFPFSGHHSFVPFLASLLSPCSCSFPPFLFFFPLILGLPFFLSLFPQHPVFPSLSYGGLLWELTASVFVGNFVLAVLLLSMAHLFAPVKEEKKKTFPTYEFRCLPRDPCLNLCCKIFFFPYEVPKK